MARLLDIEEKRDVKSAAVELLTNRQPDGRDKLDWLVARGLPPAVVVFGGGALENAGMRQAILNGVGWANVAVAAGLTHYLPAEGHGGDLLTGDLRLLPLELEEANQLMREAELGAGFAHVLLYGTNDVQQAALAQALQLQLEELNLTAVPVSSPLATIDEHFLKLIEADEPVLCLSWACSKLTVETPRLVLGGSAYAREAVRQEVLLSGRWSALIDTVGIHHALPVEWWSHALITHDVQEWRSEVDLSLQSRAESDFLEGFTYTLLYDAGDPLQDALAARVQTQLAQINLKGTSVPLSKTALKEEMAVRTAAGEQVLCLSARCTGLQAVFVPFAVHPPAP